MDDYKFRVEFMEDAKQFLDKLDEKARDKVYYNIWKARRRMTRNFSRNFKTKFGSSGQNIASHIIDSSHFGTKQTKQILW